MSIKYINRFKIKSLTLILIGSISFSILSAFISTNAYANYKSTPIVENKNLSMLQNSYFELIKNGKEIGNLTLKQTRDIMKNKNIKSSIKNIESLIHEEYVDGNEKLLIISSSIIEDSSVSLFYSTKDINKSLNLIEMSYSPEEPSKSFDGKYDLNIYTDSYTLYDHILKLSNIKLSKSNLYDTYIDLNKMLYINKSITKDGLLKYNSNFKSNEGTWYKIKDGNEGITVELDNKTQEVVNIAFWKKNNNLNQYEELIYSYSNLYNSKKEDLYGKYIGTLSLQFDNLIEQINLFNKIIN